MKPIILETFKPDLSSDEYNELIGEEIDRIDEKIMKLVDKANHGRDKEIDRLNSIISIFIASSDSLDIDPSVNNLFSSDILDTSDQYSEIDLDNFTIKNDNSVHPDIYLSMAFFNMQWAKKFFNYGDIKQTLYTLETVNHCYGTYMGLIGEIEFSSLLRSVKSKNAVKSKDEKIMQPVRDFVNLEYLKGYWKSISAAALDIEPLLTTFMKENNLSRPVPTNRNRWLKDQISKIKKHQEEEK